MILGQTKSASFRAPTITSPSFAVGRPGRSWRHPRASPMPRLAPAARRPPTTLSAQRALPDHAQTTVHATWLFSTRRARQEHRRQRNTNPLHRVGCDFGYPERAKGRPAICECRHGKRPQIPAGAAAPGRAQGRRVPSAHIVLPPSHRHTPQLVDPRSRSALAPRRVSPREPPTHGPVEASVDGGRRIRAVGGLQGPDTWPAVGPAGEPI